MVVWVSKKPPSNRVKMWLIDTYQNESCNKNSIFAVWNFFDIFKSLYPLNSLPHHLQMFLQNLNLTMGVCECFYPGKFVPNKVFTLKVCDETQTCRNKVCIGQKVCKYNLMQKKTKFVANNDRYIFLFREKKVHCGQLFCPL